MMKTTAIIFLFLISPLSFTYGQAKKEGLSAIQKDSVVNSNRMMLKNFFLCKCIDKGFVDSEILSKKDHSTAVLADMGDFNLRAITSIDSLATSVVADIPVSDLTKKRGVLLSCIDYYNGKELDKFIGRLDKEIRSEKLR